jgi:hypothetical protein
MHSSVRKRNTKIKGGNNMQKLIEGAKLIRKVMDSDVILAMNFDRGFNANTAKSYTKITAHIRNEDFKDVVEELNIQPCYVERTDSKSEKYPIELELNVDGVYLFTIMDEHTYEMDFREWHNEEPEITDEEFLVTTVTTPRGVTNEQLAMKQAGMALKDFE